MERFLGGVTIDSGKFDATLNLLANVPNELIGKLSKISENEKINQGSVEVVVLFGDNVDKVVQSVDKIGGKLENLGFGFGIVTIKAVDINRISELEGVQYAELPKVLFTSDINSNRAACVPQIYSEYNVAGSGVLVGFIDTGIDYTHPAFRNMDGTTRIDYIYDLTAQGKVYDRNIINQALSSSNPLAIVDVTDPIGHGTHVAGIACAGGNINRQYYGVAYDCSIAMVKTTRYGFANYALSTQIMRGIRFLIDRANELKKPLVINISLSTNDGAHNGTSLFEQYIQTVCTLERIAIVIAAGNEGEAAHHVGGELREQINISLAVSEGEPTVTLQLYKPILSNLSLTLTTPSGVRTGEIILSEGYKETTVDGNRCLIYNTGPRPFDIAGEITISLVPVGETLSAGEWTITLKTLNQYRGLYDIWLPITETLNPGTRFLQPNVFNTLGIPATVEAAISVGSYDYKTNNLSPFSGRGRLLNVSFNKPDISAPGEGILGPVGGGGFDSKTGTSMAAPHVAGICALLLQWGVVNGNDPFLFGDRLKYYIMRAAKRERTEVTYPNPSWGYGTICAYDSLTLLRASHEGRGFMRDDRRQGNTQESVNPNNIQTTTGTIGAQGGQQTTGNENTTQSINLKGNQQSNNANTTTQQGTSAVNQQDIQTNTGSIGDQQTGGTQSVVGQNIGTGNSGTGGNNQGGDKQIGGQQNSLDQGNKGINPPTVPGAPNQSNALQGAETLSAQGGTSQSNQSGIQQGTAQIGTVQGNQGSNQQTSVGVQSGQPYLINQFNQPYTLGNQTSANQQSGTNQGKQVANQQQNGQTSGGGQGSQTGATSQGSGVTQQSGGQQSALGQNNQSINMSTTPGVTNQISGQGTTTPQSNQQGSQSGNQQGIGGPNVQIGSQQGVGQQGSQQGNLQVSPGMGQEGNQQSTGQQTASGASNSNVGIGSENNLFLDPNYRYFTIEYQGDIKNAISRYGDADVLILDEFNAVLVAQISKINDIAENVPEVINIDPGRIYTLSAISPVEATQATVFHNNIYLPLDGDGVVIGIVDSGIDYLNDEFIREDDTTRIVRIWDQTIQTPNDVPIGFPIGTEYTEQQINSAIRAKRAGSDPYAIVPSRDEIGHGTHMAGLAAARGKNPDVVGAAPGATLAVVKLREAPQGYLDYFYAYGQAPGRYGNVDVLLAVKYLYNLALELRKPMVIYVPLGTNLGSHDGNASIERYIDEVAKVRGIIVVTTTGNQGEADTHTTGTLARTGDSSVIELRIGRNQRNIQFEIWVGKPDKFSLAIVSPSGEAIQRIPPKLKQTSEINFVYERTRMTIDYSIPENTTGDEKIVIRAQDIREGIWQFRVIGDLVVNGRYDAYLLQRDLLDPDTKFLSGNQYTTLTIPSTSRRVISVAYYNQNNNATVGDSGRGYTRDNRIKPDIAAGGINAITTDVGGGTVTISGASVAGAVTAGCCALLLQWGVVERNDPTMYAANIKTYLYRGASKREGDVYPNPQWGYGMLNMKGVFDNIRSVFNMDQDAVQVFNEVNHEQEEHREDINSSESSYKSNGYLEDDEFIQFNKGNLMIRIPKLKN